MRLRALLAAVAMSGTAAADEIILIPAEPVAPTRTQMMQMEASGFDLGGVPITSFGPGCAVSEPATACPPSGGRERTMFGLLHRFRVGVAMPLRCSCWAAEMNFFFGGCNAFYTPGLECTSCGILGRGRFAPREYGPGSMNAAPPCNAPRTGFLNFR